MKSLLSTLSFSLVVATSAVFAQAPAPTQSPAATNTPAPGMTELITGEVRKVDKDARKITLRHGEIKQLDMPAMTMVFRVKEPSMLDKVKAGDKVKFKVEGAGGALTITEIESAK